jgi:hypothetical protein
VATFKNFGFLVGDIIALTLPVLMNNQTVDIISIQLPYSCSDVQLKAVTTRSRKPVSQV